MVRSVSLSWALLGMICSFWLLVFTSFSFDPFSVLLRSVRLRAFLFRRYNRETTEVTQLTQPSKTGKRIRIWIRSSDTTSESAVYKITSCRLLLAPLQIDRTKKERVKSAGRPFGFDFLCDYWASLETHHGAREQSSIEWERVDRVSIQHTHHRHCDDAQSGANGIFSFSSPFYYLPRKRHRTAEH